MTNQEQQARQDALKERGQRMDVTIDRFALVELDHELALVMDELLVVKESMKRLRENAANEVGKHFDELQKVKRELEGARAACRLLEEQRGDARADANRLAEELRAGQELVESQHVALAAAQAQVRGLTAKLEKSVAAWRVARRMVLAAVDVGELR